MAVLFDVNFIIVNLEFSYLVTRPGWPIRASNVNDMKALLTEVSK